MSRDSNGTYSLPSGNPVSNGTTISATWANTTLSDIGSELSNSMDKAGRTTPTANLKMGGFKFTGLAAGSAAGDSVRYEQGNVIGETTVTGHATTADVFAAATARVLFDGTGLTVTAFPSSSLNTWKLIRFNGANTLTHSASLVMPGGVNYLTASGDVILVASVGSNALVVGVYPTAGPQYALSAISAAIAATTIASADFAQIWNWQLTTASKIAFRIGESAASTGSGATLLAVVNNSGSTARPFVAQWTGTANGQIGYSTSGQAQLVAPTLSGVAGPDALVTAGGAGTTTTAGGDALITAGAGGSTSGTGGAVVVTGGAAVGSLGGDVQIIPGLSSGASDGNVDLFSHLQSPATAAVRVAGNNGHVIFLTPQSPSRPTIASGGGTGVAITGSDNAFKITIGTTPGSTAIVVNYENNYNTAPCCFANNQNTTGITISASSSTSQVTLTPSGSWTAGHVIDVLTIGIGLS
jgi:hypothetical protein